MKKRLVLDFVLTRHLLGGVQFSAKPPTCQLSIILSDFIADLRTRGYTPEWLRHHIRVVEHFFYWQKQRRISLRGLSTLHVQEFLTSHLPRCRCKNCVAISQRKCRPAMRRFVEFLRSQNRIKQSPPSAVRQDLLERSLAAYDQYMNQVCGFSAQTRWCRQRDARQLLEWRFGRKGPRLKELRVQQVSRFLFLRARQLGPFATRVLVHNLRNFFRFLEFSGYVRPGVAETLPQPVPRPVSAPPKVLEPKQLRKFLNSFSRNTPRGRRDYAIVLFLTRLALRPQEVVSLTLDDLEWRTMTLRLTQTKQRRERRLPLPHDVAKALMNYLKHGRPITQSRALFVHYQAPFNQALTVGWVRVLVRRAFARCGIIARPYALRHTWATWAHRRGAGLKLIGDLLGHRCLDSTERYALVNLKELRKVALPWPKIK